MVKRDIIVIGASAGGLQALSALLGKLPKISKHRYLSSGTFRRTSVRSFLQFLAGRANCRRPMRSMANRYVLEESM